MRLIVTGSRTWKDHDTLWWALDQALNATERSGGKLTVVHGAAPDGADMWAAAWVHMRELEGRAVNGEPHPAAWKRPDGSTDKGARFARNAEMVNLGADYCLAFVERCTRRDCPKGPSPHGTHGTVDCLDKAAAARIPVRPFRPRSQS